MSEEVQDLGIRASTAVVESNDIGQNCSISDFSVIRRGVRLGNNVVIHSHVVIHEDAILGDGVIVHPHVVINANAVIGAGSELHPGTVIGKLPAGGHILSRKPHCDTTVSVGEGCAIGPNAVVYYEVEIGDYALLGDGASVREQCKIGAYSLISRCVTINCNTVIGSRVKIMDNTHITGNAWIGDHVFISTGVSTTNDNFKSGETYDEAYMKGPMIMNDVKIGAGATLLPSVVIGEGAVVGAGCLVTKDVEARSLVKGLPGRVGPLSLPIPEAEDKKPNTLI